MLILTHVRLVEPAFKNIHLFSMHKNQNAKKYKITNF